MGIENSHTPVAISFTIPWFFTVRHCERSEAIYLVLPLPMNAFVLFEGIASATLRSQQALPWLLAMTE
jgi:hypothetical protein